jgi:hypothetical protein
LLDFLGFNSQEIAAIVNSLLFQVSGWLILVAGMLHGLLERQYGRWLKPWSRLVWYPVLIYVVALTLTVNIIYTTLYMWFICGGAVISLIYYFALPAGWYLGPQLNRLATLELTLDVGILKFTHPAINNEGHAFPQDADFQADQFQRIYQATYSFKRYLHRTWMIFDQHGKSSASILLEISVQNMSGSGDLSRIDCLNGAAAQYYFFNHALPDDEFDVIHRESEYSYEPKAFSNWRRTNFDGRNAITYDILINGRSYQTQYLHCALSSDLMLTLEFKIIASSDDTQLLNKVDDLIKFLIGGFTLVGENIPAPAQSRSTSNQDDQFLHDDIKPPKFDHFDIPLPTTKQHRLALRQKAHDKVEWMVFENSDLFQGWFFEESISLCHDFDDMRLAFIDAQLKKLKTTN